MFVVLLTEAAKSGRMRRRSQAVPQAVREIVMIVVLVVVVTVGDVVVVAVGDVVVVAVGDVIVAVGGDLMVVVGEMVVGAVETELEGAVLERETWRTPARLRRRCRRCERRDVPGVCRGRSCPGQCSWGQWSRQRASGRGHQPSKIESPSRPGR